MYSRVNQLYIYIYTYTYIYIYIYPLWFLSPYKSLQSSSSVLYIVVCICQSQFIKMEVFFFYNANLFSHCKITCVCILNICHFEMLFFAVEYIWFWFDFCMACYVIHARKPWKLEFMFLLQGLVFNTNILCHILLTETT